MTSLAKSGSGKAGNYQTIRDAPISQRLKFLLKDSVLYGAAASISRLMSIFVVPILTRVFSTADYGAIDAITILGSVFISFMIMGQDYAAARFFYETEDHEERRQIISEALLATVLICLVVTVLFFLGAGFLVRKMIAAPEQANAFRVLVLGMPFVVLLNFFRGLLKWTFARAQFLIVSLGSTAAVVILTFLLVVVFHLGVIGVFYAQLIGMMLFALLGLYYCRGYVTWPRSFRHGWPMLAFGAPYMLVAVAGTLIPAFDRGFITHFLNMEAMGLYAVGYKFAFLLMLPISAFQNAWGPFGLAIYKEANASETYNKVLIYYVSSITLLAFCLVAAAEPLIVVLASSRYLAGSRVVMPLVFGLILESTAWIMGVGLDLSKRTYFTALSYVAGLTVSAVTIWILINPLGILGVAYGMMAGRLAQGVSYSFFAYKSYPLRFAWKAPGAVLLIGFVLGTLVQRVPPTLTVAHVGFRLLLLLILMAIIWRGIISAEERRSILREGRTFLSRLMSRSRLAWSRG